MKITHIGLGGGVSGIITALTEGFPGATSSTIWFGPTLTPPKPHPPAEWVATWSGSFNLRGVAQATLLLWDGLKHQSPDLVIAHGLLPAIFSPWLAKLAGAKKVIVVEHGPQPTFTFAKSLLLRLAYPWVDWTVSVSQESRAWQQERFGFIPKKKSSVIENGVDLDRFSKVQPREERVPFIVTMIARLDKPQKDLRTPIAAIRILREHGFDMRLRFVGNGNAVEEMLRQIQASQLSQLVTIEPFRPDVERVLAESNVAFLSTHWEGQPLGVLEAMAAGVPVIATDVVGVRQIINPGVNGWLYRENDPADLARVLQEVSQIPNLSSFREAAKKLASLRFDRRRMVQEYVQLVTQLVGQS